MWSAYILPFMEDDNLKKLMTIGEDGRGNFQWAHPGPYRYPITLRRIKDGTSKTMLLGEALHDQVAQRRIGRTREAARGDHKDHWYIGSDDIDIYNDSSEGIGSTGVGGNLQHRFRCGDGAPDAECQQLSDS